MLSKNNDTNLVGKATETSVKVNGIQTDDLLDTDSTVSTISKDFCRRHLQTIEIKPLKNFLETECADGKQLPYLGYINVTLDVNGVP